MATTLKKAAETTPQAGDQHPAPKQPVQDTGQTKQPQAGTPIFNDWASI